MTYLAIGDYSPKLGDTVKATLGDSVLYGTVDAIMNSISIALNVDDLTFLVDLNIRTWQIEPWSPPVTFKPLTVVHVPINALMIDDIVGGFTTIVRLAEGSWSDFGNLSEYYDDEVERALAAGKAEVLFEGVDE